MLSHSRGEQVLGEGSQQEELVPMVLLPAPNNQPLPALKENDSSKYINSLPKSERENYTVSLCVYRHIPPPQLSMYIDLAGLCFEKGGIMTFAVENSHYGDFSTAWMPLLLDGLFWFPTAIISQSLFSVLGVRHSC